MEPRPELEQARERWRRWRAQQRLTDVEAEDFATGGLGRLASDPTVRLLVLPADPDVHRIDFDDDLWSWWGQDAEDPATGRSTSWGPAKRPSPSAALIGTESNGEWWRCLAVHRHAGMEMLLGDEGAWEHNGTRYFALTKIVGRCWAALARYGEVVERCAAPSPWEVVLALRQTSGAVLADFGEGWAEPYSGFGSPSTCEERNLLMRRELSTWPADDDGIQALAFGLGAQIEDSWGADVRRFRAHRGELAGRFDTRAYRGWH